MGLVPKYQTFGTTIPLFLSHQMWHLQALSQGRHTCGIVSAGFEANIAVSNYLNINQINNLTAQSAQFYKNCMHCLNTLGRTFLNWNYMNGHPDSDIDETNFSSKIFGILKIFNYLCTITMLEESY